MTDLETAKRIAELAAQAGGRAYFVGGFVRDELLRSAEAGAPSSSGSAADREPGSSGSAENMEPGSSGSAAASADHKDIDIEVHGLTPQQLREVLEQVGEVLQYGSSFGIYGLAGHSIDIAMPRKERAVSAPRVQGDAVSAPQGSPDSAAGAPRGHRDFEVFVDPFLGTTEAARRRDFTINAMMQDVLTGEILDPFGGRADLKAGILRHVDDASFAEDPLRVLRCAQFAARFTVPAAPTSTSCSSAAVPSAQPRNFTVAPQTIALCSRMDLSGLSRERVEGELKKALLKAPKPSVFFETLRSMDQLGTWFPELQQLIGLPQDPVYHPEGDVWTHTMQVIDRAASHRADASEPYRFMLLALLHDLGKIVTTEEKDGRIHAYGHETLGLPLIEAFLRRITGEQAVADYVLNMVPLHMKPNMAAFSKASVKSTNHMFDQAAAPKDLIYMGMSDKPVMSGSTPFTGDSAFLFERLKAYQDTMAAPFVTGKDLIEAGLQPGEHFHELLAYAHKLRLAGIDKTTALKQVLRYKPPRK